jgi:hypothetical protein
MKESDADHRISCGLLESISETLGFAPHFSGFTVNPRLDSVAVSEGQ